MSIRWEPVSRCDLCGGGDFETLFTSPDLTERLVDGEFRLVRCRCGLAFMDPRPAAEDIGAVYPTDYMPHAGGAVAAGWQRLASARDAAPRGPAAAWMALREHLSFYLWPRWRGAGDVLDVGCGGGGFLDVLSQLGWRTAGVDRAADVVEKVRAKGHDARAGNAETLAFGDASFDVVCLSHVLEHTLSPRRALLEARRVLRPGGQLIVAVPNFGGLQARVFRRWWSGLDVPRHLYQFNGETLSRYLRETGFDNVHVTSRSGATSYVKTFRLAANDLFRARIRREPGWLTPMFEPFAVLMWPFARLFGGGRDLRVTCDAA